MGIQQRETNGRCAPVIAPGGLWLGRVRQQGPCPAARRHRTALHQLPAASPRRTLGATAHESTAFTDPPPRVHSATASDDKSPRISHHNAARNLGRWNRNAK